LEDKIKRATLGEASYNEIKEEAITLEDHIVATHLGYEDLNKE
jgi:hypothetical protein